MNRKQSALVIDNLPFAIGYVRRRYQSLVTEAVTMQDLEQEALAGMCEAALRFDEGRGVKFITYAVHWVRQRVNGYLSHHYMAVRPPLTRGVTTVTCDQCYAAFQGSDFVFCCPECGNRQPRYQLTMIRDESSLRSTDAPPDYAAGRGLDRRFLNSLLDGLDERSRAIIELRYFGQLTRKDIGAELGLTKERVRQIHNKTMDLIRLRAKRRGSLMAPPSLPPAA